MRPGNCFWSLAAGTAVAGGLGCWSCVHVVPARCLGRRGRQGRRIPARAPATRKASCPSRRSCCSAAASATSSAKARSKAITRVDLSFQVQDINDLLKSMVVRDLDGGIISTVNYDSNASRREDPQELRAQSQRQSHLRTDSQSRRAAKRSRSSSSRPTPPSPAR